ncbi:ABC-type transport system substrate-binding protein [Actimicrobium sp. GrIS 1.19]|uniref:ABC transporter substrate-binding protein n=1 Tax=Actimicrobium sp. GrIS 1.19 TaxID=3071708 RepID=UPI002E04ECD5|nr:ABC-type transport system substrate-binding protein [Actimicrobium sp. GrIS 1.19]
MKLLRLALAAVLAMSLAPCVGADMAKTLHVVLQEGETVLDPAQASDSSTLGLIENIFDAPLRYDYLARPLKLQANLTTALPTLSADRRTYTLTLRSGVRFTPDAAFGGKPRELVAEDLVYSIKRHYDPALKSPWLFLLHGKLVGDAQLNAGKFDIDRPIAGVRALDRRTVQIVLNQPDNNFLYILAMPALSVVAREAIEAHPALPVGTGPYVLRQWQRNSRLLLEANPDFRPTVFDGSTGADPAIAAALRGRSLPLIGRIDIRVIEEQQACVLGFLNRDIDYLEPVPAPLANLVLDGERLKPALAQRGIKMDLFPMMMMEYLWMNMEDPVIGGTTLPHIALRRAIGLAYSRADDIRVLSQGLALPAYSPLPPNVFGYDPALRSGAEFNPALARALLDRFGYVDRDGDGWREQPDGSALTLTMHSLASTTGRLRDEFWGRSLREIGIRVVFSSGKLTDLLKAARLGQVQMLEAEWIADYPDGENFWQLLYGPNSGTANRARFRLPAFDALYEEAQRLPDSPQRNALYAQMNQLLQGYAPWVLRTHRISINVQQPWLRNYKRHPVMTTAWRYLDLDTGH